MEIWRFFKRKRARTWAMLAVFVCFSVFIAHLFLILPDVSGLKTNNPKSTALMKTRIKQAKREGTEYGVRQNWVPFSQVPQLLKDTVRIAEDAGFYWHKGIDFEELKEAIKKNIQEKKFARGGSTITQQLAKNLYLSPKKNLLRKFKEYLIARKLEKVLSKDRIFELYLNVIELGPGVFGVDAASKYYFGYSVSYLDLDEVVRLVAVLPRPLSIDPKGDSPWLKWRCRWLLHKLQLYEYISQESYQEIAKKFMDAPD
ncbi:MAG: monofunctional biosynthetic peptidoglycan transglycosylase [Candidatus Aminicenantes bacterium]|nr:MAG: monofunctional biosynthetic peptidoglycan transglycosylase [Candidatus Aminicenantes bacterium]